MTTLRVHIEDKKSEKAVLAVFEALGLTYQVEDTSKNNPSPSDDPWFLNPDNVAIVEKGKADAEAGRVTRVKDVNNIWESIL